MKKFVRDSKFRHLYGSAYDKKLTFEGVNVSNSRLDGNFCAANAKFIAVVLNTSGAGVFTVLNADKPGRFDAVPRCMGHSSEILDLTFDPFYPNRLVSGAEDGSFIIWWIPDDGLAEDYSEYLAQLRNSQKRAVQSVFHRSAADIVFLVNTDKVSIFELKNYSLLRTIETSTYSDQLFNISLNLDSSRMVGSFRDKKIRVFNVADGSMVVEFDGHDGNKPMRAEYLNGIGEFVCVTGASKMTERKIATYDLSNPSQPVSNLEVDNGVSVLNLFYDADINVCAVFGKGESSIKFFEVDPSGELFMVSSYQGGEQQKAACFTDKFGCDVFKNEVMHFVKATAKYVEPVSIIVPRKSELFQEDLFPDTSSDKPAMSAEDFANGKVSVPLKLSLKDYAVPTAGAAPQRQTSTITKVNTSLANRINSVSAVGGDLEKRVAKLEEQVAQLMKKL